ncbi:hypothetical protein KP509_01G120400 [Ceratopteris richardii]|uniref:GATA-type domain-containing protein n=1 Tax=Ceratopteris richardii TaxID=49495 RepID=A0A8T2VQ20_CERRI|nr:hypothetical protein KP509_01G120400 [Ceratopteris richardii]
MLAMIQDYTCYGGGTGLSAGNLAASADVHYMTCRDCCGHFHEISYMQMLRMSLLEDEGTEFSAASIVDKGNPGLPACEEGTKHIAMPDSQSCSRLTYFLPCAAVEGKHEACTESEVRTTGKIEGNAENDDNLTCLRLGFPMHPSSTLEVLQSSQEKELTQKPCSNAQLRSPTNSDGVARVCSLCGTSKTPLWRSGPMGAKSLCNACGIRSKKATKLALVAASELNINRAPGTAHISCMIGNMHTSSGMKKAIKRKMTFDDVTADTRKHSRRPHHTFQNHTFDDRSSVKSNSCLTLAFRDGTQSPCPACPRTGVSSQTSSLSTSRSRPLTSQYASSEDADALLFPKEEEQAAFLLMALSCGLVLANCSA